MWRRKTPCSPILPLARHILRIIVNQIRGQAQHQDAPRHRSIRIKRGRRDRDDRLEFSSPRSPMRSYSARSKDLKPIAACEVIYTSPANPTTSLNPHFTSDAPPCSLYLMRPGPLDLISSRMDAHALEPASVSLLRQSPRDIATALALAMLAQSPTDNLPSSPLQSTKTTSLSTLDDSSILRDSHRASVQYARDRVFSAFQREHQNVSHELATEPIDLAHSLTSTPVGHLQSSPTQESDLASPFSAQRMEFASPKVTDVIFPRPAGSPRRISVSSANQTSLGGSVWGLGTWSSLSLSNASNATDRRSSSSEASIKTPDAVHATVCDPQSMLEINLFAIDHDLTPQGEVDIGVRTTQFLEGPSGLGSIDLERGPFTLSHARNVTSVNIETGQPPHKLTAHRNSTFSSASTLVNTLPTFNVPSTVVQMAKLKANDGLRLRQPAGSSRILLYSAATISVLVPLAIALWYVWGLRNLS
ncbi:hypothetical protein BKA62DRAFT_318119 [Auriculariales sp. MPI-PUGE-AT-0066]|nr:hypothetical protein BKA62DRAFT_318119 [Auriculariales sp. MPI-PUGE-AT-0066]